MQAERGSGSMQSSGVSSTQPASPSEEADTWWQEDWWQDVAGEGQWWAKEEEAQDEGNQWGAKEEEAQDEGKQWWAKEEAQDEGKQWWAKDEAWDGIIREPAPWAPGALGHLANNVKEQKVLGEHWINPDTGEKLWTDAATGQTYTTQGFVNRYNFNFGMAFML